MVPGNITDNSLKSMYSDNFDTQRLLKVHLADNFGKKFMYCKEERSCEQINIIGKQNVNSSTSTGGKDEKNAGKGAIGQVFFSEKTKQLIGKKLLTEGVGKKIIVMKPDVELSLLSAGGVTEPNALWSEVATNYISEFTSQYLTELGYEVSLYEDDHNGVPQNTVQELMNLHDVVGRSIFAFQYPGVFQLPNKKNGVFDWQLGKSVKEISDAYNADLGLFFFVRDSYSSGSRIAAQILVAALFGAHMQGGTQLGFVSLVDMKNGNIIWYNKLFDGAGDLRTFEPAFNATDSLLENIPL